MKATLLIARRELSAYLRSMTGYIIAAAVLIVDGLLFNAFALGGGEKLSSEVLSLFFYFSSGTTIIASVFISMRLFAEERQTGTLVLLTSSPVHDWEIVVGKFLSALIFLSLLTAATVAGMDATFLEIGPGNVLAGLLKRIVPEAKAVSLGTADEVSRFMDAA